MPIFGRRQLQHMLDELGPWLGAAKGKDLVTRIEHPDPEQALPAEYELALSLGVAKAALLEIDRPLSGGRTPDIYSPDLFPSGPVFIDVAGISNDPFTGESLMRRVANIINNKADSIRKGASKHLYYEFQDEHGYEPVRKDRPDGPKRPYRRRLVSKTFRIGTDLESFLKTWLKSDGAPKPIRWTDAETDVVISWKDYVHPMGRVFSRMPAGATDFRDNPLYEVLKRKERQLRNAPDGAKKGIFLGDAGCALLRDLRPLGSHPGAVTGEQIIRTFLEDTGLDFVVVFTPKYENEYSTWNYNNPRRWFTTLFSRRLEEAEFAKFDAVVDSLPSPYLHGYQAWSWHEQGLFDPQGMGHYLPVSWTGGREGIVTVKVSTRGLQEFLAGRLTREQFLLHVMDENDLFKLALETGRTISNVTFNASGTDEDDDELVFHFARDPAAQKLVAPSASREDKLKS